MSDSSSSRSSLSNLARSLLSSSLHLSRVASLEFAAGVGPYVVGDKVIQNLSLKSKVK